MLRGAVFGLRQDVTNCASVSNKDACEKSYNTSDNRYCIWSDSGASCHSSQVNACSSINDEHWCEGSYNGSYFCVWSNTNSACYEYIVDDCSAITDEHRCESSRIDREYGCYWDEEYGCYEEFDD